MFLLNQISTALRVCFNLDDLDFTKIVRKKHLIFYYMTQEETVYRMCEIKKHRIPSLAREREDKNGSSSEETRCPDVLLES